MTKKACRFKRGSLSLCSGLSDTNFGYAEGKPCVLLKMNRVTPAFAGRQLPKYTFNSVSNCASTHVASFLHSLNPSCFPHLTDHRPEASRGSLHQLHSQSKHAFPHSSVHEMYLLVCVYVFLFMSLIKSDHDSLNIFFLLILLSCLPSFCLFLCLISFCMLSLAALG